MVGVEVVAVVLQLGDMVVGEDLVVVDMVHQALVSVAVVVATMLASAMVLLGHLFLVGLVVVVLDLVVLSILAMVMVTVTEEQRMKTKGVGEMGVVKKRKDCQGRAMLRQMREEMDVCWKECDEELIMVEMVAGEFNTFLTTIIDCWWEITGSNRVFIKWDGW